MAGDSIIGRLSAEMAQVVASAAPSVTQVQGRRRPASGLVHSHDIVLTTIRAIGREDGLRVRRHDGSWFDAELAGWDPTTSLAVVRASGLGGTPMAACTEAPRVGHLAFAVGRSWSNNVTVSAGIISIIGGPLSTGRRRAIEEIIRTTAPMHDGFAGGAFIDTCGQLVGMTTASTIRGFSVVIPAAIAWRAAATILEHGRLKRGYLGIAGQPVALGPMEGREESSALLVIGVTPHSPAAASGMIVGDVILEFDGHPVTSPEDLLDLLVGERVGRAAAMRVLRGGGPIEVSITVGERDGR